MSNIFYVLAVVIGLLFSYMSFVFSLLGGKQLSLIVGVSLVLAYVCAITFAVKKAKDKNIGLVVLSLVSPAFLVYAGILIFSELNYLGNTYAPDEKFAAACHKTGVQIFNVPSAKVNTISLDWDDNSRDMMTIYKVGSLHQLQGTEYSFSLKELVVVSSTPDVQVSHEVSDPEEAKKGLRLQGIIRYTITATDRRDGKKLASMSFALDHLKGHACGANEGDKIDIDSFLRKVTAMPGENKAVQEIPVVPLKVIEKTEFHPDKILKIDDAMETASAEQFKLRDEACKKLLADVSRGTQDKYFINDSSKRVIDFSMAMHICHADAVWTGDYYHKLKDQNHVVIQKYTVNGDLVYRFRFEKPDEPGFYQGSIDEHTFRSENGYLLFEWENGNRGPDEIHINRRLKVKVKEPSTAAP